ncbi:MAG: PIN domain-containing protein [Actinobacteria bacterium]|nr:PIN domain-containing protein [Actinomycetota bacterium]
MALGEPFLIDKSAWVQQAYSEAARERVDTLRASGTLCVCSVTVAELLYSSRNASELEADLRDLSLLGRLHIDRAAEDLVTQIMKLLAAKGHHRAPGIADLFVAAVGKASNATVLHYDKDFELIADVTGQRQEWVIPRGSGHGRD